MIEVRDGKVERNVDLAMDWTSMLFYKPSPAVVNDVSALVSEGLTT